MIEVGVANRRVAEVLFRTMMVLAFLAVVSVMSPACNDEKGSENRQVKSILRTTYSAADFGDKDSLVRIGVQPLFLPTGLILQTMKRDQTLADQLMQEGKRLKLFPFFKGEDINQFQRQGHLEVCVVGDMPALTAAATSDITIPVLIQQGFVSVVARRPMLLEDLRGLKIGYPFGSNAHHVLLTALANGGLNEYDVHMVQMETSDMPEALHSGAIDAFSAWEPVPALCLSQYPQYAAVFRSLSNGFLYFRSDFVEENPVLAHCLVAAVIRAIHWLQDDRLNMIKASEWTIESINSMIGKEFGLSAVQMADLAALDILGQGSQPKVPESILAKDGALNREFVFLKSLGKISSEIEWSRIRASYDRTILTEVQSDASKHRFDQLTLISSGDIHD